MAIPPGLQEEAKCVCGHYVKAHARANDGIEYCIRCQLGTRKGWCGGFRSAADTAKRWPACTCGHEFHKAHCRDSTCSCTTYTVPAGPPLLVQAAALRGAGVKTVTVVVPLAGLADLTEEQVARAVDRELSLSSNVIYVQRDNGLFLVLKDDAEPDSVGEAFLSDAEQIRRLEELRAALERD